MPLLIAKLSLVNVYNGYMILPILSAVTQVIMTKITPAGCPARRRRNCA